MKKLSFIIAMVLVSGFAMAQKTTILTQGGYGNSATITQDASLSLDANKIYATQNGSWNTLTTDQLGKDNYIDLAQGGDNNSAKMVQQSLLLPTDHNSALINQGGTADKADLTQKGTTLPLFGGLTTPDLSNNKSVATQFGTSGRFILNQGNASTGIMTAIMPVNNSYLTQSGYGNNADLNQFGLTNYSEISQLSTGSWNTADLDQMNPGAGGSDKSYSWQYGDNSTIDVIQTSKLGPLGSSDQYAYSKQEGTSNTTKIEQISKDVQKVDAIEQGTSDILTVTQHY